LLTVDLGRELYVLLSKDDAEKYCFFVILL